jgi:integrase
MAGRVEAIATKDGTRYRIRWDLPRVNGQRRQRTTRKDPETGQPLRTKREAKAALAKILHEQWNEGRESVRSDVTLGEFATAWVEGRDLRPTALDNLRTALVHIVPRLGSLKVQNVRPEHVAGFYRDLAKHGKRAGLCRTAGKTCAEHGCSPDAHDGLGAKSIGHVHAALRAILAQAVEDGLIPSNPAETTRARQARPKGGKTTTKVTEDQCWSPEQARAFIDATADDRLGALWATMLGTGVRRGEALALRWQDVNLRDGTLHVRRSVTTVRGQVVESDGKTDAARRRIVIGPDLVAVLRAHRKRQREERVRLGPVWAGGDQETGVMFTEEDGRPIHPNKASTAFTRACEAAGLPPIGLHGLRHTHATMLVSEGVPLPAVTHRLGHKNASITLAVYAHFMPKDDTLAADATGRLLFGTVTA